MTQEPIDLPGQPKFLLADNSRGSILVIALWAICLLATFAVVLGYEVRQKTSFAYRLAEREKLSLIAAAGVKKGIAQILKEEIKTYDALQDLWSNNSAAFQEIDVGEGKFSISYNYLDELSGTLKLRYGLVDEERKINLNTVDLGALRRLFQIVLGFGEIQAQELAASIIDWRDADSGLSIPSGSAEDPYYKDLQYPYEAKDAPFEVPEELLLVKGMDEDIFYKIRDYITVYGSGKININTASRTVLLALGLSDGIIDKIFTFRCGKDKVSGTQDDNFFDSTSNIVARLKQFCELSDPEMIQLGKVSDQYLVTNSNYFMVNCTAHLYNKKNTLQVLCVIERTGRVLYWQQA
jgi:general secretion pathway protein K